MAGTALGDTMISAGWYDRALPATGRTYRLGSNSGIGAIAMTGAGAAGTEAIPGIARDGWEAE